MLKTKLNTPFGIEIDYDLSVLPDDAFAAEMRDLLAQHHLLIFRKQTFTQPQQKDFCKLFGPVLPAGSDGDGFITNEDVPDNFLGSSALAFHSDLAFSLHPFWDICLYADKVEDGRSSTFFANSIRAYERLSEAMKARLKGLHVLHVFGENLAGANPETLDPALPRHVHPLVMKHPRTGQDILYIARNQSARIIELEKNESDALLAELFDETYRDGEVYEHKWMNGDFVFWDNYALQHARGNVANVGIRRLRRIVNAEYSFFEMYPQFRPAA